jgi:general secretion pathway protein K
LVTILGRPLPSNLQGLDVRSNYFEIVGSLRLDELIVSQRSLVERVGLEVRILSVERVGPGVLMLAPTAPPF